MERNLRSCCRCPGRLGAQRWGLAAGVADSRLGTPRRLRAALGWARERGEAAWGLRLAVNCGRVWYMHGMRSEGAGWLEGFLALDAGAGERAAEPETRLWALYGAGRLALERADLARAQAHAHEARGAGALIRCRHRAGDG